jgi:ribosome maturation protein SDO1
MQVSIVERALKDMHFAVKPSKSAKQQALEAIRELKEHIPIARAAMRLRITCALPAVANVKQVLLANAAEAESECSDGSFVTVVLVEPGTFRALDEGVQKEGTEFSHRSGVEGGVQVFECRGEY